MVRSTFCFVVIDEAETVREWNSIGYLGAALKKIDKISVEYYFVSSENAASIIEEIGKKEPFAVGLPVLNSNIEDVVYFAEQLKKRDGRIQIILGNLYATVYYKYLIEKSRAIDIVVIGEGENTLVEVCKKLIAGLDWHDTEGICFLSSDRITINSPRKLQENIDLLAFPDRSFIDHGTNIFSIIGSRGCSGTCTFCEANSVFCANIGSRVRYRSVQNIVEEIENILQSRGLPFAYINFDDQTFSYTDSLSRLSDLYTSIRKKKLNVQFCLAARAEQITDAFLQKLLQLKQVGLTDLFIGIEAGNSKDLKLFGKRASLDDNDNALVLLQQYGFLNGEAGISLRYGCINLHPYSSFETLRNNQEFLRRHKLFLFISIFANRLAVSGGNQITTKIERDGLLSKGNDPVVDPYGYIYEDSRMGEVYDLLTFSLDHLVHKKKINIRLLTNTRLISCYLTLKRGSAFEIEVSRLVQYFTALRDISHTVYSKILDIVEYSQGKHSILPVLKAYELDIENIGKELERLNTRLIIEEMKEGRVPI